MGAIFEIHIDFPVCYGLFNGRRYYYRNTLTALVITITSHTPEFMTSPEL